MQPEEVLPGFDTYAGRTWIYPTNYPVREYQFTITQAALFKNTLVCLPTGEFLRRNSAVGERPGSFDVTEWAYASEISHN